MTVLDALATFGIPAREPHYHHGNPSQLRYGQHFHKNILENHPIEQRIIRIVKELHEQGFSLRKISKILNGMRVATKCRGKGWHPEMVRRVLGASDGTDK